jgi:hypothetical protein
VPRYTFNQLPETLQGEELVRRLNQELRRIANAFLIETHVVKTVDFDYALQSEDRILQIDTSTGPRTVTLMLARSAQSIPFTLTNIGTANDTTVNVQRPATETIGDSVSTSLTIGPGQSYDLLASAATHWSVR